MCSEQAQDITLTEEQCNELNLIIRKRSSPVCSGKSKNYFAGSKR